MIYKILYGSINSDGHWWDGNEWRGSVNPNSESHEKTAELMRHIQYSMDIHEKSIHADGVFKCPRCWQRHYLCDTFDFLCDMCVEVVRDHVETDQSTIDQIDIWKSKDYRVDQDVINRMKLRQELEDLKELVPDELLYNDIRYTVINVVLDNDGTLLLRPTTSVNLLPKDKAKLDIKVGYKKLGLTRDK